MGSGAADRIGAGVSGMGTVQGTVRSHDRWLVRPATGGVARFRHRVPGWGSAEGANTRHAGTGVALSVGRPESATPVPAWRVLAPSADPHPGTRWRKRATPPVAGRTSQRSCDRTVP